jgi:hypothetical protein
MKRISKTMVKSIMIHGTEVWDVNRKNGNKCFATEMDYLRRNCIGIRLERIQNVTVREIIMIGKDIIDDMQKRQLIWFGHTNGIDEKRWSGKLLKWLPQEKCKWGRTRGPGEMI